MVSTRNHPSTFDPQSPSETSPSKNQSLVPSRPRTSKPGSWTHTPDRITLTWLLVSLPLVLWDIIYVFGRPHTMPGGWLNKPMYAPYTLYGQIDHIYGWEAWNEHNGFTAAQTALNLAETVGYLGYLYIIWAHGTSSSAAGTAGRGRKGEGVGGFGRNTVSGGWGGLACLLGFSLAIITVSKTCLYGLNEAFSGFKHIGHNDAFTLFWAWIFPNGSWIVFPSYLAYTFGRDILHGLAIASGDTKSKPARAVSPSKDD